MTARSACALVPALLAAPAVAQQAAPVAAAAAEEKPTFDIDAYDVDGNTVLDQASLERAVYPHLGPRRTQEEVGLARDALEAAYRARGYQSVVVEIPVQSVVGGVIKLHVVEAPVGRLRVVGSRYYSLLDIKRQTPALAEGKVPDFTEAQKEINALNRQPGRQVTPLLRPGLVPGTVDVDLKVADQNPLHASVEVTNDHSPDTMPLRLTGTVRYDNLWQRSHSLSATYSVAPENRKDSEVYAGSYLAPLRGTPLSLLLFGYNSNSNVATLGGATVLGKGYAVGFRALLQLPSAGPFNQSLSAGFDYKHFLENLAVGNQAVGSTVDYWPANASYTVTRQTDAATTRVTLGVTAGTRGAGSDEATLQNKRADARGNFVHANLDLEHTQSLPHGFTASAKIAAQIADQPLVSSEQFAAGGLNSVRGYLQSEAVGDNGISGSFELRSPVIDIAPRKVVDDWRAYAFLDAAELVLLAPLPGQKEEFTLYSAGVGTRFQLFSRVDGDLVVGVPLKNGRSSQSGQAYGFFSLKTEF